MSIDGVQIPSDDFDISASMCWPVQSKSALKFGKDTLTTKRVEMDIAAFICDEDWDTTLSYKSWTVNAQKIALPLPGDHALKGEMSAIDSSNSEFLFTLSIYGLNCILHHAW